MLREGIAATGVVLALAIAIVRSLSAAASSAGGDGAEASCGGTVSGHAATCQATGVWQGPPMMQIIAEVHGDQVTMKCEDGHSHCAHWALAADCAGDAELLRTICPLSCRVCTVDVTAMDGSRYTANPGGRKVPAKAPSGDIACDDAGPHCKTWAMAGLCDTKELFMEKHCPVVCGFCARFREKLQAPSAETPCQDGHKSCMHWAAAGECVQNFDIMQRVCPLSCQVCTARSRKARTKAPRQEGILQQAWSQIKDTAKTIRGHLTMGEAGSRGRAVTRRRRHAGGNAVSDAHALPAIVPGGCCICKIGGDLCRECASNTSSAREDCPLSCKACARLALDPSEPGERQMWAWHSEALSRPFQMVPRPEVVVGGVTAQPSASTEEPPSAANESAWAWAAQADEVRTAFLHAWRGYCQYAWGNDELRPDSRRGQNSFGGIGMSILDSLTTLWLLNMPEEFERAAAFVEDQLEFGKEDQFLSVFELTIRALGGLLGAHALSGRPLFLRRARELATLLLPAFKTPSGFPVPHWNLKLDAGPGNGDSTMLAEVGSLQLEWRYLANATGHGLYDSVVSKAFASIQEATARSPPHVPRPSGLLPVLMSPPKQAYPTLLISPVAVGGRADSYYEYLLKQWLQEPSSGDEARRLFWDFMEGLPSLLRPVPDERHQTGQVYRIIQHAATDGKVVWKMEHLTCFLPGLIALALLTLPEDDTRPYRDLWFRLADGTMTACVEMWTSTPSGLAPEHVIIDSNRPHGIKAVPEDGKHSLLRPETVESLYYMYRLTQDQRYREAGVKIFRAIHSGARAAVGYSSVADVRREKLKRIDDMQSFVLAETFKYLYLLFAPEGLIDLEEYVFNTEGHPLRRFGAGRS